MSNCYILHLGRGGSGGLLGALTHHGEEHKRSVRDRPTAILRFVHDLAGRDRRTVFSEKGRFVWSWTGIMVHSSAHTSGQEGERWFAPLPYLCAYAESAFSLLTVGCYARYTATRKRRVCTYKNGADGFTYIWSMYTVVLMYNERCAGCWSVGRRETRSCGSLHLIFCVYGYRDGWKGGQGGGYSWKHKP